VQNAIWGLLKLECYPRFRAEEGVVDKIKKSKLKILQKKRHSQRINKSSGQILIPKCPIPNHGKRCLPGHSPSQ